MKLFTFTSQTKPNLFAFTADSKGGSLPDKFGPWTATGVVREDQHLPGKFPRLDIERGVTKVGYQLWRKNESDKTDAAKDGPAKTGVKTPADA
jgi:hypothetical protein